MDIHSGVATIESSRETSLRDLVAPLFRKKVTLAATFLTVFVLVLLAGVILPPPYKSYMAVLVNRQRADPIVSTESTTQLPVTATEGVTVEEINSESQLLLSQDVLEKVVIAAGLDKEKPVAWFSTKKTEAERVAKAVKILAKQIKVKNETNSNLIEVTYNSSDPRQAYAVLDALGKFYLEKHAEVHRPVGSYEFFANETQKYHDALENSEAKLRNFSRQYGIAAPDVVRTQLAQTLALSTGQLFTIQQAIAADGERIRSDEGQLSHTPQRVPTLQASGPADKLLEDLGASLLAAQTKRTQLALKYDDNYPLVKEADDEIKQTEAAIAEAKKTQYVTESTNVDPTYELLREDLAKTKADQATQIASEAAAKKGIASIRAQMVDLDQQAVMQQDLMRDTKSNEDSYLLYLGKREQERTSNALDRTSIGNVTIAVPPGIPVLPLYNLKIVFVVAFAAALFLSIGMAFTVDYFDSSFHNPVQVADTLGIPIVITMSKRKTA